MSGSKRDTLEVMVHQNKIIWDETVRYAEKYDHAKPSEVITDPSLEFKAKPDRVIKVFNNSLLEVAEVAAELGLNPLVINAGSDNDPLRVLTQGAIGTEWDLFRRSNLHTGLNNNDCYPLRNGSVLYTSDVTVFRNAQYKLIRNPYKISVLTIPPLRRPRLVSSRQEGRIVDTYCDESEAQRMRNSIETMFKVALLKGHRCIVVDDFGCQHNCENPIDDVIKLFNETIVTFPVKYVFFAITEPLLESMNRDNKKHNAVYKNYTEFDRKVVRY